MLQPKKFPSNNDIEKKEQEIEALLKKVLRSPIGEYKDEREKLERIFNKIQEISTVFGDRLSAVPDTVQSAVEKLRNYIEDSLEDSVEELEKKVDSLHDAKIVILEKYLNQFDEYVQKTPDQIKKITHELKEDVDTLVAEKTMLLSGQIDRLPHTHKAMEARIQVLFEALERDLHKLAEKRQQKHLEMLTSFDQCLQSNKDLSSKVTCEVEKIPEVVAQRFKEVVDECQSYLKNFINRHIDQVEENNRQTAEIQEKIKIDLQSNSKIIQEVLDNQLNLLMSSSKNLQYYFDDIKNGEKLILSNLQISGRNAEKELLILKNELAGVHRNAQSHKMVLMVLLIITLFVACGNGVLEVVELLQH